MWIGIYLWVVHAGSYLRGYFWGLMSALVQTIVGDVIPFERRGRAMGIVMTSFSVSTVVGVPLGLADGPRSAGPSVQLLGGCGCGG